MNTRREGGFTLIELLVAMALMLIIGAISLTALVGYNAAKAQQQTADSLLSDLRKTGQRAVSEGRTYCLHLDDAGDSWTAYQSTCAAASPVVEPTTTSRSGTTLSDVAAQTPGTSPCPVASSCIYFYPRGTATQASVDVARSGKPSITVTVEGLTGRVDRT